MARTLIRDGFLTRAAAATERAWNEARPAEGYPQRPIADKIAADLAALYAQLGRTTELTALVEATKDREMSDYLSDQLRHAGLRFGPGAARGQAGTAGNCGAAALMHMLSAIDAHASEARIFQDAEQRVRLGLIPGASGWSLQELRSLADLAGTPARAIRRGPPAPGAADATRAKEWPVPSVIHWKRGHYSALLKRAGSRYLVRDRALGGDRYVTEEALREEASGFLLVQDKALPKGWVDVPAEEAGKVFGATYNYADENPGCPPDPGTGGGGGGGCCGKSPGMPGFDFKLYRGSLRITDTPVGYTPARGPEMQFTLTYNQIDPNVTGANFGPNWSWEGSGWPGLAYVQLDENHTDAWVYLPWRRDRTIR